ncbi:hypothetical protein YK48G_04120 [Lentilactobacillus fungorum]|uniref:Uncharacterized protein n=1 Tax=Lentilactobacillus fungorum TaxID=2201250 RepID=A0ABQ3VXF9_9LACO|nr:hypothetical protein [Lentilactobacillus fungorum]GHP12987.1 hypothetical protein YK48G_04120 [Lentilactobacillus fungorum]
MSKLMTMEEWEKQRTTKETAPMDMPVFEPMLNGHPLEFEDRGITYSVPIGQDVKMIFEGLIQLVNDNLTEKDKAVDDGHKLLAVKFAHEYCKLHKQESEVNTSGRNQ